MRGLQSRHPRADDRDEEVAVGVDLVLVPLRRLQVFALHCQLAAQEGEVAGVDGLPGDELHHPAQRVVVGRGCERDPVMLDAVAQARNHLERQLTGGGALLVEQAVLAAHEELRIRAKVVAQEREVARDLCECGEEGR